MTPRFNASAGNRLSMFVAPRILKAPPGCCGSHFNHSGRPARSETSRTGVRRAMDAMRVAAARTSDSETKDMGRGSQYDGYVRYVRYVGSEERTGAGRSSSPTYLTYP